MPSADVTPMILAAGHATRLRPLTATLAKAVVPFLNRPLLDHTLEWLGGHGFERVLINLHHAGETIAERYGHRAFGIAIEYSREPVLLGTAGGPRNVLDRFGQRLLIVNGDVVGLLSLGELIRHHRDSGALATLALHRGSAADGYPQVTASTDGRLLAFPGDQVECSDTVEGVFTGLHLIERDALELLPADTPAGTVNSIYDPLLRAGLPIHAIPVAGTWYEVGDPQRYIDNQLSSLHLGDVPLGIRGFRRVLAAGYRSPDAHLENVRLVPPYLAGAGVRLRHGAQLEGVVLGDRTRVGAATRLRRTVTWPDSWVGPECDLRNAIVMRGVHVPGGTVAENTVFTADGPIRWTEPGT